MAKKKGRRLKKSVKVGCSVILLLIAFGIFSLFHYCSSPAREDKPVDTIFVESHAECDINTAMQERLQKFIHQYTRLDTTNIAISVYDLSADTTLFSWHDKRLMPPASCMKLLTAISALSHLGMDHRYVEQAFACGKVHNGTLYGTLLLQLDDNPLCESLQPLLQSVRNAGINRVEGDVVIDLLRRDTLRAHPTAATWDIPYHKVPLLLKGASRVERDIRYMLAATGISVHKNPILCPSTMGISPDDDPLSWRMAVNNLVVSGRCVARKSTKMTDVITPMLIHSSNIKADALYWHLDNYLNRFTGESISKGQLFADFIAKNLDYPEALMQGFVINDGSGLSKDNLLTAHFLRHLLIYAWHHDEMRRYLLDEALATPAHPVRHGSLLGRMSASVFRNRVFCKTGTLTTIGASSLSGYIHASDGHWYAFSVINQDSPVAESRIYQDKFCKEMVR